MIVEWTNGWDLVRRRSNGVCFWGKILISYTVGYYEYDIAKIVYIAHNTQQFFFFKFPEFFPISLIGA